MRDVVAKKGDDMRTVCIGIVSVLLCMSTAQHAQAEKFAVFVSPTNTHGITVLMQNEEFEAVYCRATVPKDTEFLKETLDAHLVATGDFSCNVPLKVVVEKNGDRTVTFRVSKKLQQQSTIYLSSGQIASAIYVLPLKDFKPSSEKKKDK